MGHSAFVERPLRHCHTADRSQGRLLSAFVCVCGLYALVAIIQVVPHALGQIDDPIWLRTGELLGLDLPPRISSRAEIPLVSVGHFLLFATSFMSGFFAGTSRSNSHKLIQSAQYSILFYAVYGLAALILTPNMVLWVSKVAYRGSLTATFINHNTAATFVGAGAVLWSSSAFSSLRSFPFSSIRMLLLFRTSEHLAFKVIARSVAALACFFALLLTGSRGGLISSCLGLLVAIILMVASGRRHRIWHVVASASVAVVLAAAWLIRVGRIGSQGLFDDARWSVYGFCMEAIRERPLFGSGLGTFSDLFPSLRADDFYSWGVWDYAHSTILEIALEMGIPVTAMIVIAAFASLFILGRASVRSEGRSLHLFAATTGIVVLSYLHSTIDFSLQIPGYLIPFSILFGCGLARATSTREVGATVRLRTRGVSEARSGIEQAV